MKQIMYTYKVVNSVEELEKVLNSVNTSKLLANVLELGNGIGWFLIVWED